MAAGEGDGWVNLSGTPVKAVNMATVMTVEPKEGVLFLHFPFTVGGEQRPYSLMIFEPSDIRAINAWLVHRGK